MDNFQNNEFKSNESEQTTQNSYSYSYPANNNVYETTGSPVEPQPRKKKRVFTKVIAFAVCAAVISAGSITAYKYIDDNFSFKNFFSSNSTDINSSSASPSASNTVNSDVEQKSLMELASREDSLSVPDAVTKVM
ncbi:MAG: hypothetical protein IJX24_06685, partial [Oscillospiraceae bacterium]|nr:hypothetical protein [Oscillospiraceae bacterium]